MCVSILALARFFFVNFFSVLLWSWFSTDKTFEWNGQSEIIRENVQQNKSNNRCETQRKMMNTKQKSLLNHTQIRYVTNKAFYGTPTDTMIFHHNLLFAIFFSILWLIFCLHHHHRFLLLGIVCIESGETELACYDRPYAGPVSIKSLFRFALQWTNKATQYTMTERLRKNPSGKKISTHHLYVSVCVNRIEKFNYRR